MDREKIDKVIREKTDFFDSSEEMDEFLPKEKDFATSNANAENEYFSSWESINYSMQSSITSVQLDAIVRSLGEGYYIIPEFQRQFVWKKSQIASLAFSIIKGFPIPPIYMFVDEDTKKQVILDGQQRITAVFLYINELYFASETKRKPLDFQKIYALKNDIIALQTRKKNCEKSEIASIELDIDKKRKELKGQYGLVETEFKIKDNQGGEHDISFSQFNSDERNYLIRRNMSCSIVECRDSIDSQKFYAMVFKVLNSGGKTLGTQEIRNGIYWKTRLYKELHRINSTNINWRKIYGNISLYSKDIELLLKMLALNDVTKLIDGKIQTDYEGTFNWVNIMETYSEKELKEGGKGSAADLQMLERFLNCLTFDAYTSKCNKAVFEAVFVCMCKAGLLDGEKRDIEVKLSWLIKLGETAIFDEVLSNKSSVETRLSKTYIEVINTYEDYK